MIFFLAIIIKETENNDYNIKTDIKTMINKNQTP